MKIPYVGPYSQWHGNENPICGTLLPVARKLKSHMWDRTPSGTEMKIPYVGPYSQWHGNENPICGTVLPVARKLKSHMWDHTAQKVKECDTHVSRKSCIIQPIRRRLRHSWSVSRKVCHMHQTFSQRSVGVKSEAETSLHSMHPRYQEHIRALSCVLSWELELNFGG